MLMELAIATMMALTTVVMHGAGLLVLGRLLEFRDRRTVQLRLSPVSWVGAAITVALVIGLFVIHGLEIWLYAVLFHVLGAVPDLREAVYFSTISYGAIGYSDAAVAPEWKLLGAIEGINGVLLMGWSIAFFVTAMTRFSAAMGAHRTHIGDAGG